MAISLRAAHSDSEGRELVTVLQNYLPYLPHERLFDWQYRANPEGEALAWVATDSASQQIVGLAAAFPRKVYCCRKEMRGYVLGDFCIAPQHRSLGLALALQRACLDGLSRTGGFAFDFPSTSMLAVYKRLRVDTTATMIRYAKPLRADRKIAARIPVAPVAQALSAVVNTGLRWRDGAMPARRDWTIAREEGVWGEEFTEAARNWAPQLGACVARTARYLNWRYREHPQVRYEMLTARQSGRLRGYLVYHTSGTDAIVDDLVAGDNAAGRDLLMSAASLARAKGIHTLSAPWLSTHPGTQMLKECGFRPREARPVILLPLNSQAGPDNGWYLSYGDWEA